VFLGKIHGHKQQEHIKQSSYLINGANSHIHGGIGSIIFPIIPPNTIPPFNAYQQHQKGNEQSNVVRHGIDTSTIVMTNGLINTENRNSPKHFYGKSQMAFVIRKQNESIDYTNFDLR
jgi:hypothetical protein